MPAGAGPDFVNAVVEIETALTPEALLAHLHGIEAAFERDRTLRWGPRTLDLDLLALGGAIRPNVAAWQRWARMPVAEWQGQRPDRLLLPHPRMQERAFVLVPLAEIAPDWRHPVLGTRAADLRDALPEAARAEITPI